MVNRAKWSSVLVAVAGLMGSAGVAVAAAGTHLGASDSARIAAEFLLIHGAVVLAAAASNRSGSPEADMLWPASVLAVSGSMFGADLALAALANLRPLPLAAPIGGMGLIAGWLMFVVVGWRRFARTW